MYIQKQGITVEIVTIPWLLEQQFCALILLLECKVECVSHWSGV